LLRPAGVAEVGHPCLQGENRKPRREERWPQAGPRIVLSRGGLDVPLAMARDIHLVQGAGGGVPCAVHMSNADVRRAPAAR